MHLTLIEPHHHYEALLRWIPVCVHTEWKINVISSKANWSKLREWIAEDCSNCTFYDIKNLTAFPKTDFLIFISMQINWQKWISRARQYPSALLIHNGNLYFNPRKNFASPLKTSFSPLKYWMKWIYEQIFNIRIRQTFLKSQNIIIPYSPTQLQFFQKYCVQKKETLPTSFRQGTDRKKTSSVLLNLHNRLYQIDQNFFKKCLKEYQSPQYQELHVICNHKEFKRIQPYFHNNHNVLHHIFPLPTKMYYRLFQKCKYYCFPFQQDIVFNIYNERIGVTKYSGRIRDAIEFGCELHMPDYIPREQREDLPTLEEAVQEMESKLAQMYRKTKSKYQ